MNEPSKTGLSIVIVNYNVRHFLEQALHSIRKSVVNFEIEVWVVDNHSTDSSVAMVKKLFPEVHLIQNDQNLGFSRANNQALEKASGEFVLLLNPDTLLQEDTLQKCWDHMKSNLNAGAVGVKMLDGSGQFLPESKRGFPSPMVAFYKAFGLSGLFPRSRIFNRYHLGFLDENEMHEVDVLCGAFMFIRKEALDKAGLLDEQFFMYGEDIDLSRRIQENGYQIHYLPETHIIHFKGESTKKGSLNYVITFYRAMILFCPEVFSRARQEGFYRFAPFGHLFSCDPKSHFQMVEEDYLACN